MLKADGTKFGKTAGGAVWLDPKKTSPYEFYQFWFNQDDRDVVKYLKYFTFLTKEEIDTLDKEVQAHPENRTAQKRLAEEVTRFVHGEAGLAQALKVTAALFSGDIAELTGEEIEGAFRNTKGGEVAFAPVNIVDALVEAGVEKSKRQAREDITNGAVRVNGMQIKDTEASISAHPNTNGRFIIIRKGKKNYFPSQSRIKTAAVRQITANRKNKFTACKKEDLLSIKTPSLPFPVTGAIVSPASQ